MKKIHAPMMRGFFSSLYPSIISPPRERESKGNGLGQSGRNSQFGRLCKPARRRRVRDRRPMSQHGRRARGFSRNAQKIKKQNAQNHSKKYGFIYYDRQYWSLVRFPHFLKKRVKITKNIKQTKLLKTNKKTAPTLPKKILSQKGIDKTNNRWYTDYTTKPW